MRRKLPLLVHPILRKVAPNTAARMLSAITPAHAIVAGLKAARNAIELFDKNCRGNGGGLLHEFFETCDKVREHEQHYTEHAAAIVHECTKIVNDARGKHSGAVHEVREWVARASLLLDVYVRRMDDGTDTGKLKKLVVNVLKSGVSAMGGAVYKLGEVSTSLNEAAAKMNQLRSVLDADFDRESSRFKRQVEKQRAVSYSSAAAAPVAAGCASALLRYSRYRLGWRSRRVWRRVSRRARSSRRWWKSFGT